MIDVSQVDGEAAEKVSTTEVAKQSITQGIKDIDRLARAAVKGFRMWHTNDKATVIKFSVEKEKKLLLGR